eukprot:TRINITY_DN6377_c0_g1_i1.p1 TRINITY_DN6377_c0_g1~~TRINITY_DN6377_c0_g1_i1.p1  ORF type:complete len:810 (+),score=85.33 TRINITY_DN6377_c0_g1_i1:23-2431(+)
MGGKKLLLDTLHKLLSVLVYSPGDDKLTRTRKTVMTLMMIVSMLQCSLQLMNPLVEKRVWSAFIIVSFSVLLAYMMITRRVGDTLFDIFGIACTVSIIGVDAIAASAGTGRRWSFMVIVVDAFLVCQGRDKTAKVLIACMTGWVILDTIQTAINIGLYDAFSESEICSCSDPPCIKPVDAVNNLGQYLMVFFLDYYITRNFFTKLMKEKAKMEATIQTVQKLASGLAIFDLDFCEETLERSPNIPENLKKEFSNIVSNLKMFRVYLPDGLFGGDIHDYIRHESFTSEPDNNINLRALSFNVSEASVPPPGIDVYSNGEGIKPEICIAFTDIKGSTALWELAPAAMRKALAVHNSLIRTMMLAYQGYEVKIIGDAFMVAFGSAYNACCFGLGVQEQLYTASFPVEIDALRIRIGINIGPADIEFNPVTGRYDYFGSFVNKAARVEGACIAGGVAVTRGVLDALCQPLPEHAEYVLHGVALKGIKNPEDITILVPVELPELVQEVENVIGGKDPSPHSRLSGSFLGGRSRSLRSYQDGSHRSVSSEAPSSINNVTHALKDIHSLSCCYATVCDDSPQHDTLQGLVVLLHCCDRTDGTVLSVMSNQCYVSWNTAKRCNYHLHAALRFASGCILHLGAAGCSMGVATGHGSYGAFGYGGRRFITLLGPLLRLSEQLCVSAKTAGSGCFHAVAYPHHAVHSDPLIRPRLRPVDVWNTVPEPTCVYEVSCDSRHVHWVLDPADQDDDVVSGEATGNNWGWSEAYWAAFNADGWDAIELEASGAVASWAAARGRERVPHRGMSMSRTPW